MGGGALAKEYPNEYFMAAFGAAVLNYPLWRASAVGQSGFQVAAISIGGVGVPSTLRPYVYAFAPPYRGLVGVVLGMTWARAAIFWGSDYGKDFLQTQVGVRNESIASLLPPLVVSTLVQVSPWCKLNMPFKFCPSQFVRCPPQSIIKSVSINR